MSKWIQNAHYADIAINCCDKITKQLLFRVVFGCYKMDTITGRLVQDGYTELEDEKIALLKEHSNSFNKLVGNGKLIVSDKAPLTALNSADRVLELQEQLNQAKARIVELEAENAALKGATVKAEGDTSVNEDGSISADGVTVDEPPKDDKPKTNKGKSGSKGNK